MEDRAVCMEDLLPDRRGPRVSFFGVYDGHNGNAAVDFVSSKVHRGLHAALSAGPLRCVPEHCLWESLLHRCSLTLLAALMKATGGSKSLTKAPRHVAAVAETGSSGEGQLRRKRCAEQQWSRALYRQF